MEFLSEKIKERFPDEYAAAEKLYRVEADQMYKDGYMGDFGCGFSFAIDTYGPMCWLKYFLGPHATEIKEMTDTRLFL